MTDLEMANKFPKLYVTANWVGKTSIVMDYPPTANPAHTTNLERDSEQNMSNVPSPSFDTSKQCLQHLTHPYIAPKGI